MNERIKELAEQAGIRFKKLYIPDTTYVHESPAEVTKERLQKFAELIVEEFDLILANEYLDCVGENDNKSQVRIDRLRNRVKKYFGVES